MLVFYPAQFAKEIHKNIGGLRNFAPVSAYAVQILEENSYQKIAKTRYVNDKQITDHYGDYPDRTGLFGVAESFSRVGKGL